ncbi:MULTISPECIES: 5-oxoprolinase subunit PxpA [Enterobacterales]|nr:MULTISPECIES: 5-oxoprolinase subunit PxpA [Enterobacterales]ELS0727562.1 5-oxoprolinase subunit PxpA [Klebsiella michiganensis]HBU6431306.1 5-oxoprolinase subunit PxpA [Klebsiella oxytoca]HCB0858052.1 5-oxoprolinase subunit PxpA [Klebsiella pneumoniae]HCM9239602.1 5-oxoprolinase subunit PxpA [Enterobacter hormaechei subsp. steigerwaltii]MCK7132907.1 5-oxoprolinase subunit PxpA [Enterobacter bugandensis]
MMKTVDINSDIGESFGSWIIGDDVDNELMTIISSDNIATGFHAGDPSIMRKTVESARKNGVAIGAHPGFNDLQGFGRRHLSIPMDELVNDIIYQLGALREFARLYSLPLQHIKPHGALYMHLARDETAAQCFVAALHQLDAGLYLYCMAGSAVWQAAQRLEHPVVTEFYADREYDDQGLIVFTRSTGRLNVQAITEKVLMACLEGKVKTVTGNTIPIRFDSICIHSDTPGALEIISSVKMALINAGINVCSPGMV